MSQLMTLASSETSINYTPDLYSAYADSFDLSLLSPSDEKETLSSSSLSYSPVSSPENNINNSKCDLSSTDALNYIQTAIFNNNVQSVTLNNNNNSDSNNTESLTSSNTIISNIKTEKLWNCDSTIQSQNKNSSIDDNDYNLSTITSSNYTQQQLNQENCSTAATVAAASLIFQQLQKQYQYYPSPLPSPPQYEFSNLNSVSSSNNYSVYSPASSTLSPSPCPSLDQPINQFGNNTIGNTTGACNTNNTTTIPNFLRVKQEYLILPPSPPDSNGSPSPSLNEIKSEPGDNEIEANLLDINNFLEKTLQNFEERQIKLQQQQTSEESENQEQNNNLQPAQDYQLLREYLQDTSFQKKHNLKPLALESLIGGLGVRGDIEPVISLALEHAKREAQATCAQLQISPDPQQWTATQVHAWIRSTIQQFKLQQINELELKFPEDGANLLCLTEEEFVRRVPESGATIHAQLEIWKLACCDNFQNNLFPAGPSISATTINNNWPSNECDMDYTDDEDDDFEQQSTMTSLEPSNNNSNENGQQQSTAATATITNSNSSNANQQNPSTTNRTTNNTTTTQSQTTTKPPRTGGSHIHLWQFLKELLASPQVHGTAIRWLDRNKGVFKIEDSVRVAKLWGRRKNRPAMNYDKLSRSIRQYYKKGIMKKTERSQRLVYQFCHPYCL